MSNKDEMMHASVANVKWNAPLVCLPTSDIDDTVWGTSYGTVYHILVIRQC